MSRSEQQNRAAHTSRTGTPGMYPGIRSLFCLIFLDMVYSFPFSSLEQEHKTDNCYYYWQSDCWDIWNLTLWIRTL